MLFYSAKSVCFNLVFFMVVGILSSHVSHSVAMKVLNMVTMKPRKGFGQPPLVKSDHAGFGKSTSSDSMVSSTTNPKDSMEAVIQKAVDDTPGLRQALTLYDSLDKVSGGLVDPDKESVLRLMEQNDGWSKTKVHNRLVELTWDTAANFREARHQNQELSYEMESYMMQLSKAILHDGQFDQNCILDVGCGNGILLKFIKKYTDSSKLFLDEKIFHGVDLSSEMIGIARQKYPKSTFSKIDFLEYQAQDGTLYSTVVFNECLHNFIDIKAALTHAASLLRSGGLVVVSHPRGYSNVLIQHRANKWLVPSILPAEKEWTDSLTTDIGLELLQAPKTKDANYLAVLKKI